MPSRLAASLAVLALFAVAPAGAQAANAIRTTSVTASAIVPSGGTSTSRLECPSPWVALSGAVTSRGTGVTVRSSRPGSGAADWRFRFAADTSDQRRVRTVLRCVRLEVPAGISGARLNVRTQRQFDVRVPVGGTASVGVRCGSRAWVATGYGYADPSGNVRLASVVPGAHGWRFVLENVGSADAQAELSARCLRQTVTAGSAQLRFQVRRPSFIGIFATAPITPTASSRCRSGQFSLATGSEVDPSDTIELASTGPSGRRGGLWRFRQISPGDQFRGHLVCLARGSGFH